MNNTQLAKTARETENAIIDFGVGRDLDDVSQIKYDASVFVSERNAEKGRLLSRVIAATVEEGITFQFMFDYLNQRGESWEKWVNEQTPYDPDTARHYRNVAMKFRDLITQQNDDVLQRTNLSALYKLAVQDVPVSTALRFFALLADDAELKGDVRLAAIAKNPEIANRYQKQELTKQQAYELVKVIDDKSLNSFIRQLCLTENVSWGGVVSFLNRVYLDWCKTQDAERPNKTWANLVQNDFYLMWADKTGDWSIHIGEATAADCRQYMNARQLEKIALKMGESETVQSRATCRVTRKSNGEILLTVMDSTALPVNFKTGTIVVELLTESLEIEK